MIQTVHGIHPRFGRALAALGWPADARRTAELLADAAGERCGLSHLQAAWRMNCG